MQPPIPHKIKDQTFWLSPLRAIFWEEQKALIASDLHFGKTGHFRKAGIAVPQAVFKEDMQRLIDIMHYFQPQQVIAVGDLFHSRANRELDWFKRWRDSFSAPGFILVKGNHDILRDDWYTEAGIQVREAGLVIENFCFTHEHCINRHLYTFCGHIHPGVALHGPGRQSLRFPCFYFTPDHCVLPAFSKFTGLATIRPSAGDAVFAVVENSLIQLQ